MTQQDPHLVNVNYFGPISIRSSSPPYWICSASYVISFSVYPPLPRSELGVVGTYSERTDLITFLSVGILTLVSSRVFSLSHLLFWGKGFIALDHCTHLIG